jgi:hypothetical protein
VVLHLQPDDELFEHPGSPLPISFLRHEDAA